MTVIVLVAAAGGLRGHVDRWMVEVAAGIYIGRISRKVRDLLWNTITERIGSGQAIMMTHTVNEQGWICQTAGRDRWLPVDVDGITLFQRPG